MASNHFPVMQDVPCSIKTMMHEVNMTCQIDAQMEAKAGKIEEKKNDVRYVVCVSNKGRMQKGDNPQKNIKIYVHAR